MFYFLFFSSDPNAQNEAAALSVLGGSLSDPADMPGLAHYLEHCVFLGSDNYPDENGFAKFLKSRALYILRGVYSFFASTSASLLLA